MYSITFGYFGHRSILSSCQTKYVPALDILFVNVDSRRSLSFLVTQTHCAQRLFCSIKSVVPWCIMCDTLYHLMHNLYWRFQSQSTHWFKSFTGAKSWPDLLSVKFLRLQFHYPHQKDRPGEV